ncbi:subtilisin-like serine protease QhpE [Sphingobium nicotianae]|uniref:S8 family serine peptidase n=1 Tax=Sphingobium nicotianae TaxID=2782607 RepID=A0A9X1IRK1_9SPHN|nr:S8 family serine peptidase [Sphingobium nicotianae]MBT2187275.1 S8 family serine peptidase [Sphingobium nicotianae]
MARPFPASTGRGVRVAVVDSGVHPDHPHIDASRIDAGVTILADGTIEAGADATLDRLGHGTAVTAAIQEKAPDATCLPVRVFRDGLKTSAAALVTAIRWAVAQEAEIVNLSLGSINATHRDIFARVADEAVAAGILIVAAREANDLPCYPGALPQVLGVAPDWECPRERYRIETIDAQRTAIASGYPRAIPGVPLQRNLYGISFAVAQMSGFAALACERVGRVPSSDRAAAIHEALAQEAALFSQT